MKDYFILIAGDFSVGKTTFINTISDDWSKSLAEFWGARIKISADENLILLELTGSRRFDMLWELAANEVKIIGCVVLVDSNRPEDFRWASNLAQIIKFYLQAPLIIAANKQDQEMAWDAEAIQYALLLPKSIPVFPCIAHDKNMVKSILIRLCEMYLQQDEILDDTI